MYWWDLRPLKVFLMFDPFLPTLSSPFPFFSALNWIGPGFLNCLIWTLCAHLRRSTQLPRILHSDHYLLFYYQYFQYCWMVDSSSETTWPVLSRYMILVGMPEFPFYVAYRFALLVFCSAPVKMGNSDPVRYSLIQLNKVWSREPAVVAYLQSNLASWKWSLRYTTNNEHNTFPAHTSEKCGFWKRIPIAVWQVRVYWWDWCRVWCSEEQVFTICDNGSTDIGWPP